MDSFTVRVNNFNIINTFSLIIFFLILFLPINANSFCSSPSDPGFLRTLEPSIPYCVNEWNNTHTCEQWEIENYNSQLTNYNNEVDSYIGELNRYVRDASSYAECLANRL